MYVHVNSSMAKGLKGKISYVYDRIMTQIKEEMEKGPISINELAKMTGLCSRTIRRFVTSSSLNGQNIKTLLSIAIVLNIDPVLNV